MQTLQTMDKNVKPSEETNIQSIITSLSNAGFPMIANRLAYLHAYSTAEKKTKIRMSLGSLERFNAFITECESTLLADADSCGIDLTPEGFIMATWEIGNSILVMNFYGVGIVKFDVGTIDRSKQGIAPIISGKIQQPVITKCVDALINATEHVENQD